MPAFSHLSVQGSPFEVGFQLGRFGQAAVHQYLLPSAMWQSLAPWRGSALLRAMQQQTQQRFPAIWEELRGLAEGLGMRIDDALLWNCRGDLWAMAPDGCSTVQWPGAEPVFAHNEDGAPGFAGHCALATVAVQGAVDFTSFLYPGSMPGHTFACTAEGLCFAVNNIRSQHVEPGVPRMVLGRAVLQQPAVEAALRLLREMPRAGAFHYTLGQAGTATLWSVEFGTGYCSVQSVDRPGFHANHAIHSAARDYPQLITGSSGHRQLRGHALLAEVDATSPKPSALRILRDAAHPRFPIWRDQPDDPDNENTLATAVFTVQADGVAWDVYDGRGNTPAYRLRNAEVL